VSVTARTSHAGAQVPRRNAEEWNSLLNSPPKNAPSMNAVLNGDGFGLGGWGCFAEPPESLVCRILGLREKPRNRDEIKEAFRRRVRETHPDLQPFNPLDWGSATAWGRASRSVEFQEIVWAREVLLRMVKEPASPASVADRETDKERAARAQSNTYNHAAHIEAEYDGPNLPGAIKHEAARTALLCGRCARDIGPEEPVHRERWNAVSCSHCSRRGNGLSPCDGCGRPAWDSRPRPKVWDGFSYGKRTFCCGSCQDTYYRRRRSERLAAERLNDGPRHCDECNKVMDGQRADSRYCSPACRQRAYRQRKAEAS
jgi:hypothetical protein